MTERRPRGTTRQHDGARGLRPAARSRAFTLIELLVVISILAVLVSILMPSLDRALELARLTKCMANTNNIGKATQTCATVNKRLPLAGLQWGVPSFTPAGLDDSSETKYTYYTDSGTRRVAPMVMQLGVHMGVDFRDDSRAHVEEDIFRDEVTRIFQCPSLTDVQEGIVVLGRYNGWRNPITEPSSYGFSEGILGHRGAVSHAVSGRYPAGRPDKVSRPSETLLCLEAKPWEGGDSLVFFDVLPSGEEHATFAHYWEVASTHGWGTGVDFDRHDHRMSVVFADGHCESEPTGESAEEPDLESWDHLYVVY
ncbi:MAG: type II secretion system protein [Phycisphaerae bacterium]|nr:type II secretion system protein [Phycisphaerae bacterium]